MAKDNTALKQVEIVMKEVGLMINGTVKVHTNFLMDLQFPENG